jgi:pyridoxine 4-dehydrogenase
MSLTTSTAGHVTLGDLTVNRIGLGTNRVTDTEAARAVLKRAVELGVNFIDTANVYQSGQSEQTIGDTLAPYPKGVVIATKGGYDAAAGWIPNNDQQYLAAELEKSLKRLKVREIQLYQLHRVDPAIPIEETVGWIREQQSKGLIRHIGLSEVTVELLERARKVAQIVSVQNEYNMFVRKYDAVLEYCEANNIVFIPFYPLAKKKPENASLLDVAKAHNATATQIAIAWLLRKSKVMLPIPGTLSVAHLESNVAAGAIELTDEEFDRLNQLA